MMTNTMRKWIDLAEDFTRDSAVINLPVGHVLYHGTEGDWNPSETHINGPAWFGDEDMAENYTTVMGHENPAVLEYETTRPLRLLDVSEGTLGGTELGALWDDDLDPRDMAYACMEAGYDGWYETDGEIMIYDTTSLRLTDA